MSDFLHSLRNNRDKRFDRTRRGYESPSYRSNDRQQNSADRKKSSYRSQQNEQAQIYAAINKLLPTIQTFLESMTEDRKRLIQTEERKAAAMEAIASSMRQSSGETDALPIMESIESVCENEACAPVQEEVLDESENLVIPPVIESMPAEEASIAPSEMESKDALSRDELVEMLKGLRREGLSYEKIAKHLQSNAVPTISGRGIWRGQAVSKLCQ